MTCALRRVSTAFYLNVLINHKASEIYKKHIKTDDVEMPTCSALFFLQSVGSLLNGHSDELIANCVPPR